MPAFDVDRLHDLLDAVPVGRWVRYADLASAVGTAGQGLGSHFKACTECEHVWRVLHGQGRLSSDFVRNHPTDRRTQLEALADDGIRFRDGLADPSQQISVAELVAVADREPDPTDLLRMTPVRREQRRLRRQLLGDATDAACFLCGRVLPVELLVAAHIVPRHRVDEAQRRDPEAVFPACVLGCDALFELGYIGVDEAGRVTRLGTAPSAAVAVAVDALHGREVPGLTPGRARRFAEHRTPDDTH
ncbi:hypothetical protein KR76_13000 [Pimelobacter simplex]|uniref:HNH endonuclease n=2 Tax=Nocardioides simplex TaxID=2045 RepID=A0A0C5XAW5_NOCSI|nr:hypothetical protein KR76_13000 [Pimelobacter simplex]